MDRFLLSLFQHEVALQCRFVLLGFDQLKRVAQDEAAMMARFSEIVQKRQSMPSTAPIDWDERSRQRQRLQQEQAELDPPQVLIARHWFAIQNILTATANLSKLLWGSRNDPGAEERRAPLRTSLGISGKSALYDLTVRNQFEHIDEKIEKWFNRSDSKGFIGRNIGGAAPAEAFGHYDPDTGIATFFSHSISLREIVDEVRNMIDIAEAEASKPPWD